MPCRKTLPTPLREASPSALSRTLRPPLLSLLILSLVLAATLPLVSMQASAAAPSSELYEYDGLVLNLHLHDTLSIVPSGANPSVERVTADLRWYPQDDYRQSVDALITTPTATKNDDSYHYAWNAPQSGNLDLALDATVRTSDASLPVTGRVPFPITSLPPDVAIYTKPDKLTDTDAAIQQQALSLAAGKDDLFEVVYSVADWVTTNVQYNLSSVSADATEPSTWVMANRKGVCKEMTALFISMLRSLGIPARFVSGVAYTNLPEFANPWGGHAWAEVWFPGTGWVPFDPTYGTYGFVDATHIKLQDSADAGASSVDFAMLANDANLLTRSLDISVDVVDKQKTGNAPYTVTLAPFDNVGLDSYDLVTATITNDENYYVSERFSLAQTQGLLILGSPDRNILLKPHETKTIRFLVRTGQLADGFRYTFPLALYAGFNQVANSSFEARLGDPVYDAAFFGSYLNASRQAQQDTRLAVSCTQDGPATYVGEQASLTCNVTAVVAFKGVSACLSGQCATLDLAKGETKSFPVRMPCDSAGMKALLATAKVGLVSSSGLARYSCVDPARVVIGNLTAPASLAFDERGDIDFTLSRGSESLPENVTVKVIHPNFQQGWSIAELVQPQRFSLTVPGQELELSNNTVRVVVTYQDALGKSYETEQDVTIQPRGFTFLQKIQVLLMDAQRWIEGALA